MALLSRIVIRRRDDFKVDVFCIDPRTPNRQVMPPVTAGPHQSDIDRVVRNIKSQLERAGHQVEVTGR